ncbi:hypothetical protein LguiB_010729 [Lonicera macranthoides]
MWIIMDQLLQIGHVEGYGVVVALASVVGIAAAAACIFSKRRPKGCLDPQKFKEFKLVRKRKLNHNTDRFTFSLPTPTSVLGLPVGQHIRCRFDYYVSKGKDVTLFQRDERRGMARREGTSGAFHIQTRPSKSIWDACWRNGITPMFQVNLYGGIYLKCIRGYAVVSNYITPLLFSLLQLTRAILENPKDKTKVHLIYANTTFEDILLKEELDGYASKFPNHFKVYYVLSQPPERWKGGIGHISKDMIQSHCPAPSPHIQNSCVINISETNEKEVLRCGPPQMNKAMASHLNDLYYTSEMQFEF